MKLHIAIPLALLLAAPMTAQKPAKSTAKNAAAVSATKDTSFRAAKLTAIDAWLTANKKADDRADALAEAADLAFEMAEWSKAKGYAETYIAEFAKAEKVKAMNLLIGRSLGNIPGSEAAAKEVFEKAIESAGDDFNAAVEAAVELADLQCALGEKDEAKDTLGVVAAKFDQVRGLKEFLEGKKAEFDELGEAPKPIEVTGFDGKPISLEKLKGKVVLIDFWATWCGPCVAELPNVIATYKKYRDQGFEVVGISLDDDEGKLKDFLASHDMPWPQFFDGKGWKNEIGVAYGVKSIPKTYLLGPDGKVARVGVRGPALPAAVAKLLAKSGKAAK